MKNTEALTTFLLNTLKARFQTIDWQLYPDFEKLNGSDLPLATLELSQIALAPHHDDRHYIHGIFDLKILFNATVKSQLLIRDCAMAIMFFLEDADFSKQDLSDIQIMSSGQDYFAPETEGFTAWQISFGITALLAHESIYGDNSGNHLKEIKAQFH